MVDDSAGCVWGWLRPSRVDVTAAGQAGCLAKAGAAARRRAGATIQAVHCRGISHLRELDGSDLAVLDRPGGQVVFAKRVDQVGPAFPEPDVLDIGAGRARGRRQMRVKDGELVAVVLEEP